MAPWPGNGHGTDTGAAQAWHRLATLARGWPSARQKLKTGGCSRVILPLQPMAAFVLRRLGWPGGQAVASRAEMTQNPPGTRAG